MPRHPTPNQIAGMEELYERLKSGIALQFDLPPSDLSASVYDFIDAVHLEQGIKPYQRGTMLTLLLFDQNPGKYKKKILLHTCDYEFIVSPTWDGWTSLFYWGPDTSEEARMCSRNVA